MGGGPKASAAVKGVERAIIKVFGKAQPTSDDGRDFKLLSEFSAFPPPPQPQQQHDQLGLQTGSQRPACQL